MEQQTHHCKEDDDDNNQCKVKVYVFQHIKSLIRGHGSYIEHEHTNRIAGVILRIIIIRSQR